MLAGRLEPREVILRAPVLTLYQEVENLGRLKLPEFDGDGERSFPRDLFVCLKTARVRVIYRENGEQVGEGTLPLDAAFSPQGDGIYGVLFYETPGDRGPAFRLTGKAAFDPELGDLQDLEVSIPLRLIESLLPPRSRAAMADYQPAGLLKVTKASDGGDRAAVVELQGVPLPSRKSWGCVT